MLDRGDGWSVVPSGLVRGWLGPSTSCWAMFVRPYGTLCEDRSGVFPIHPSDKCRGGTGGQSSLRDLFVAGWDPALRAGLFSCVPAGLACEDPRRVVRPCGTLCEDPAGSCVRAGLACDGGSGVFQIRPSDKCRGDGFSVVPLGLVRGWLLPSTSCWAMFVRPYGTLCEDQIGRAHV